MKRAVLIRKCYNSLTCNEWSYPVRTVEVVEETDSAARIRYIYTFSVFGLFKKDFLVDKWISLQIVDRVRGFVLEYLPDKEPEPSPVFELKKLKEDIEPERNVNRFAALEFGENNESIVAQS